MAVADAAARRTADRRLSIALGASLLIHGLTIAALRGQLPAIYAFPEAGRGGLAVLQAVLAPPKSEPVLLEPILPEPTVEPELLLPPAANPLEVPEPSVPPPTGPRSDRDAAPTGAETPAVRIGVGTIDDPAKIGTEYVARLAERFPVRAEKAPLLQGVPIVVFPPAALESRQARRIVALLTVAADGSIADAQLASDDPLFGPVVLDALKSVRFEPAEIGGKPIAYWAIVEFVFEFGPPASAPAPAERRVARRGAYLPLQPSVGR